MTMKLKIRAGNVEVEYEGPEAFVNKKLPKLISDIAKIEVTDIIPSDESDEKGDKKDKNGSKVKFTGTTNTVASKLVCKSGPDLIVAAATRLTLVLGKNSFQRQELLKEMKVASSYYKKSYEKNLTQNLKPLLKSNKLNEIAKDTYSLSAETKTDLKKRLRK